MDYLSNTVLIEMSMSVNLAVLIVCGLLSDIAVKLLLTIDCHNNYHVSG